MLNNFQKHFSEALPIRDLGPKLTKSCYQHFWTQFQEIYETILLILKSKSPVLSF